MKREVHNFCRGCPSYCGLVFSAVGNEILGNRSDPDHVGSAGFKCIKGDMSMEIIQEQEPRYKSCMKRDANGHLAPIGLATLLDEVADRIALSIEKYGPRSVALYIGTGAYRKSFNLPIAKQFMSRIGSASVFSTMTIDQSAHWVVDGRMGMFVTGKPTIADLDLIVLAGTNPTVSHSSTNQVTPLVNHIPKLNAFRKRGGKIIVIDPRRTETARVADLHLQPKPGHDTEIFAGFIRIILAEGWHDVPFTERWVKNVDALKRAVEPYTLDVVAERAGIPPVQLAEAARMIGSARKVSMGFGSGVAMAPNPNTAAHMIEALNALCGGFVRAGDFHRNPGVFNKKPLVEGVVPPNRTWEREPKLGTGFGTIKGEFPSSRLPDEILLSSSTQIRTLIVLGANPMMAFGDPERLRTALESLECLVVVEPRPTETTEVAHYVVAPPLQYEGADINMLIADWTEIPYVQYADPVVAPPEETINEWEFFNELARRLGHTLRFAPYGFGVKADGEIGTLLDHGRTWTTEDLIELTLDGIGQSISVLRTHPHGYRIPETLTPIKCPERDEGARLDVCPPDVAAELKEILQPLTPNTFKYTLIVRRIVELMNSEFRSSTRMERRYGSAAPLYMHPDDITEEHLESGSIVSIVGERGSITARVRPDSTMRRKIISMPHCWNGMPDLPSSSNHTSWLVSMAVEDVQPIDGMPQHSGLPVNVTPMSAQSMPA
jgi:anaerobic selenocysteine-containing dehydrogenase